MALADQSVLPLQSAVNAAYQRVDVVIGGGLQAAVVPHTDDRRLAFHAGLRFDDGTPQEEREALLGRLRAGADDIDYVARPNGWLEFTRSHALEDVTDADQLVERFCRFVFDSFSQLRTADTGGLL